MMQQVWRLFRDLLSRQWAGGGMKAVGCIVVAACGRRQAVFGIAAAAACGCVRRRDSDDTWLQLALLMRPQVGSVDAAGNAKAAGCATVVGVSSGWWVVQRRRAALRHLRWQVQWLLRWWRVAQRHWAALGRQLQQWGGGGGGSGSGSIGGGGGGAAVVEVVAGSVKLACCIG